MALQLGISSARWQRWLVPVLVAFWNQLQQRACLHKQSCLHKQLLATPGQCQASLCHRPAARVAEARQAAVKAAMPRTTARVRKKFQWAPYSLACSGYWAPFRQTKRARPAGRGGSNSPSSGAGCRLCSPCGREEAGHMKGSPKQTLIHLMRRSSGAVPRGCLLG